MTILNLIPELSSLRFPLSINSSTPKHKEFPKTHKEKLSKSKSPIESLKANITTHHNENKPCNHETTAVYVHQDVKNEEGRGRKRL